MTEARKADAGQAEVRDAFEEAQAKGFFGASTSSIPNEAYTLRTGPASPSALDAMRAQARTASTKGAVS